MITYREADHSDLRAIIGLLSASELRPEGVLDPETRYWVAESSSRVVGVIGLELGASGVLLRSAVVAFDLRGQGIGQALTREALSWARSNGYATAYCFSTDAGRYWLRSGFQPCPVSEVLREVGDTPQLRLFETLDWLRTEEAFKISLRSEQQ